MDKKEMKKQYLLMRLADPNVEEWEKKHIKERLGIVNTVSESDFLNNKGSELRRFVSNYFDEQLNRIRREKRTNLPFNFFSENLKSIYYLSFYDTFFESDSFIYCFDKDADLEEINGLIKAFEQINRHSDAQLIKSALKKRKYSDDEVEKLQNHFWDNAEDEIETDIDNFIRKNLKELMELQTI